MFQLIVNVAQFLAEVALGVLVIAGFICWWWFFSGLLYYREHKDLPEYHVLAEKHEGLQWYNAWRWTVSDTYRPLKDKVAIESSIFGVAAMSALIWVLLIIVR